MTEENMKDQSDDRGLLRALVNSQRQLIQSQKQFQEYSDKIRKTDREEQAALRRDLRDLTRNVTQLTKVSSENKQDMNHVHKQLDQIHDTLIIHDGEINTVKTKVAVKNGKLVVLGTIATIVFTASVTWWFSKGKPQEQQIKAMESTNQGVVEMTNKLDGILTIMQHTYQSNEETEQQETDQTDNP